VLWHCWLGGRKGIRPIKEWWDGGGGRWLVWVEWRPAGWSVCLPLLIFPCTIKSRSSLLALAHPGGHRKKGCKMVVVVVTSINLLCRWVICCSKMQAMSILSTLCIRTDPVCFYVQQIASKSQLGWRGFFWAFILVDSSPVILWCCWLCKSSALVIAEAEPFYRLWTLFLLSVE